MEKNLTSIFYSSVIILVIVSFWPGSLLGYLFYNDLSHQPELIKTPLGTTINHFIYYTYISSLGFFLYLKSKRVKIIVFSFFFFAALFEFIHLIVPNRSFELGDLIANILGVIVAYFAIKIYLLFKNNE